MTVVEARAVAFRILTRHGDVLQDDVSLNDLIEDIAEAISMAAYELGECAKCGNRRVLHETSAGRWECDKCRK